MAKTKAIEKSPPPSAPVDLVVSGITDLARAFGGDLVPERAVRAFSQLKQIEDAVDKVAKVARTQVLELVRKSGQVFTDAGSIRAQFGEFVVEARPTRTGYDPKRVEALLRAKELDLQRYMDAEVVYKLNTGKLADAVAKKKISADELETCRYEPSYALQKPKLAGED